MLGRERFLDLRICVAFALPLLQNVGRFMQSPLIKAVCLKYCCTSCWAKGFRGGGRVDQPLFIADGMRRASNCCSVGVTGVVVGECHYAQVAAHILTKAKTTHKQKKHVIIFLWFDIINPFIIKLRHQDIKYTLCIILTNLNKIQISKTHRK